MKGIAKFSPLVFCFFFLYYISQAADNSPIKYGINLSYVHSFCDINTDFMFQDKAMSGIGIGANVNYNLFENEAISHSLELRSNYEMFNNERSENSFLTRFTKVSENGDTTNMMAISKEYIRLKLNYVNLDFIYCFSFLNKHIGIEIGPSLSFLVSHGVTDKIKVTNPFTNEIAEKIILDDEEIDDAKKFNFTINLGLNFPIQCKNFEVVPFVSFKPRTVYDENSGSNIPLTFKTNNLSAGVILRY